LSSFDQELVNGLWKIAVSQLSVESYNLKQFKSNKFSQYERFTDEVYGYLHDSQLTAHDSHASLPKQATST
jgi:hypothetical protein